MVRDPKRDPWYVTLAAICYSAVTVLMAFITASISSGEHFFGGFFCFAVWVFLATRMIREETPKWLPGNFTLAWTIFVTPYFPLIFVTGLYQLDSFGVIFIPWLVIPLYIIHFWGSHLLGEEKKTANPF